ncbi:MAG TPA: response regulator [Pyrinomonadaceae bacterium]
MNTSQTLRQATSNSFSGKAFSYAEKRPLVLIAQNADKARATLKELLDLYDLKVVEAGSGEEAVDAVVIRRPDLIIVDKHLPGLGSFEAIRLIRSIISLSIIPIVFLSDYPERTERCRAFEAGCDEYLVKPLDLDRLDSSLEKFLFQTGVQTCRGLK